MLQLFEPIFVPPWRPPFGLMVDPKHHHHDEPVILDPAPAPENAVEIVGITPIDFGGSGP